MEEQVEEYGPYRNELAEIIDTCLSALVTLSEIDDKTYDQEIEDIIKVKSQTYRLIYCAQAKLLKDIKSS
jgi:hypothetical protein